MIPFLGELAHSGPKFFKGMKQVLVWLFILHSLCLYTQRTVRCLVLNHSYDPPRPEKFAKLTPLNGGQTLEQETEIGLFELKISGITAGKPLELILSKEGYQKITKPRSKRIFRPSKPKTSPTPAWLKYENGCRKSGECHGTLLQ